MRALIIPDVHLKPWIFKRAAELMRAGSADIAICLMDIADDWRRQYIIELYIETYDAAIQFAKEFPATLWCYGNHDLGYEWNQKVTGYSPIAPWTVCQKLRELRDSLEEEGQIAYLHRIDKVLFCHGGLTDEFVRKYIPAKDYNDIDKVISTINGLDWGIMWQDLSPIWYRPQYYGGRMYKPRKLLQVVGHTPVETITRKGNLISCDVFSTNRDREPIGSQEFLLIDTETWEHKGIPESGEEAEPL